MAVPVGERILSLSHHMLHGSLCRHPLLTRAQKQHRPLTERKAIVIAQVAQFSDPFKCRMMVSYFGCSTQQCGPAGLGGMCTVECNVGVTLWGASVSPCSCSVLMCIPHCAVMGVQ